jgi:hypothetical protein
MREFTAAHAPADAAEIVTGRRLQECADVSLVPRGWRAPRHPFSRAKLRHVPTLPDGSLTLEDLGLVDSTSVIFVYGHEVDAFMEAVWPRLTTPKVLVTHNSDAEVGDRHAAWLEREGSSLRRWFAQNVTASHPRLTPLPIGIGNPTWPHGDLRVVRAVAQSERHAPKQRLVFARFDPSTYPPRLAVWEALRPSFPELDEAPPGAIPFKDYLAELARHRFAICPRGNGIDTYRVWESLYLGVVPVVERSTHTSHWASLGLPLLLIDDWREVTPEFLNDQAGRFPQASRWPELPDALRLSTYTSMIVSARAEVVRAPHPAAGGSTSSR